MKNGRRSSPGGPDSGEMATLSQRTQRVICVKASRKKFRRNTRPPQTVTTRRLRRAKRNESFYHREHRKQTTENRREEGQREVSAESERLASFSSSIPRSRFLLFSVPLCSLWFKIFAQKKPKTGKTEISPWDVEAREYLGTPQSEAAVKRGLDYLAVTSAVGRALEQHEPQ